MYRWQDMRTPPGGWSYYCSDRFLLFDTLVQKNQWLTAALRWWWSVSPLIILLFPVFLPLPLCCVVVVVVFGQVMLLPVMATAMFWMVLPLMAEVSSVGWMLFSLGAAQHRQKKISLPRRRQHIFFVFNSRRFTFTWICSNGHHAWRCNDWTAVASVWMDLAPVWSASSRPG